MGGEQLDGWHWSCNKESQPGLDMIALDASARGCSCNIQDCSRALDSTAMSLRTTALPFTTACTDNQVGGSVHYGSFRTDTVATHRSKSHAA